MLEVVATTLLAKGGGQILKAIFEDRPIEGKDGGEVVAAMLQALVMGMRQAEDTQRRVASQVDELVTRDPYQASMTAGTRLLDDASPAHRRPQDRDVMLSDARQAFAEAVGHAQGDRYRLGQAEVMMALTWLALGSPEDFDRGMERALNLFEQELVVAFALACRETRELERARARAKKGSPLDFVLGGARPLPIGPRPDAVRYADLDTAHDAARKLLLMTHPGAADSRVYLCVPAPETFSLLTPALPAAVWRFDQVPVTAFGVGVHLTRDGAQVVNRRPDGVGAMLGDIPELQRHGYLVDSARAGNGTVHIHEGGERTLRAAGAENLAVWLRLGVQQGVQLNVVVFRGSHLTEMLRGDPRRARKPGEAYFPLNE